MTDIPQEEKALDRVRKLLAKAEAEGVTPPEAQALTSKAAELMARYGIDRALLAASGKVEDKPGSRLVELDNPWKRVKGHLLCGLASAMRCRAILLTTRAGLKVHLFGYESDLERVDILYTSILIQMSHGLATNTDMPAGMAGARMRSWSRSWLLGFSYAVTQRVQEREDAAAAQSGEQHETTTAGKSTALVLADRSQVIKAAVHREYPVTRQARTTYSGTGYGAGYEKGQRADLGTGQVRNRQQAIPR